MRGTTAAQNEAAGPSKRSGSLRLGTTGRPLELAQQSTWVTERNRAVDIQVAIIRQPSECVAPRETRLRRDSRT